ncbi:phosphoadenylyl-sulfate reductase [Piscinibacter sp. Jin2]|uniref:Adenosine 5'-phosphosulfate reductase n=1 Tax=Aquariibacter lacus TaxID=2801332 RepID=A0A9X1BNM3_9BURK|nr:phosphoadenylyl-sulfate reductase [Piscinibacter lacus]MBL0720137.1 phosphoadenylyl-sulfate reductase [Piscinibacter lacus]
MSGDSSTVSALPGAEPAAGSAIALYARKGPDFKAKLAATVERLSAAAAAHPGRIVQATSLGAEDMVITDLIARHRLPIAIGTLDTGALHAETVDLIDRITTHYGLPVEVFRPQAEAVVTFVREHGERAMYESLALRKACCGLRKLEPLGRMLKDRSAWITGLRREQSEARGEVPFEDRDDAGRLKLNALADWRWGEVWAYIAEHGVPFNPLHDQFMPSIGCAPCTRAIAVGEPFRAGRWWWEDEQAKECGLHVSQAAGH